MKIAIVDDHNLFAEGLKSIITDWRYDCSVDTYSTPSSFLSLIDEINYDIIMLDLSMPEMDGFEVSEKLNLKKESINIIIISMHAEPAFVLPAIQKHNVNGYLLKTDSKSEIIQALDMVSKGKTYFSDIIKQVVKKSNAHDHQALWFTSRELDILRLLEDGLTSIEIAEKLNIHKSTVETHKKNMLKKSKAGNTIKLIKIARDQHFLKD